MIFPKLIAGINASFRNLRKIEFDKCDLNDIMNNYGNIRFSLIILNSQCSLVI